MIKILKDKRVIAVIVVVVIIIIGVLIYKHSAKPVAKGSVAIIEVK